MERKCVICGKEVREGMTNNDYDFYCCEGCFEEYMNQTYGYHGWMALGNGETDEYGGYYIAQEDVPGGYVGTGIYYTEFE